MALNRAILEKAVGDKLTKACLSAIVTEAVMRGLPFNASDVAIESDKYAAYVTRVIDSLHGETMLSKALEANASNPAATKYLKAIDNVIKSTVNPAVVRICNEATNDPTASMAEVVDKSAFTPEEMKEFIAKGKDLDVATVANVIKDKVVATIKDEKEAYDSSEQLKQDIKDTLAESVGEDAPSTESWIDAHLAKNDPRRPVSLFSRLQDTCIETLLATESTAELEMNETVSLESLLDVTINQSINCFDRAATPVHEEIARLQQACEALEFPEAEQKDRIKCAATKSLIMTIVIMTVMETLKTMRLFCPSPDSIQRFVDTPTNLDRSIPAIGEDVGNKIAAAIAAAKGLARNPELNRMEMSKAFDALSNLRTSLDTVSPEAMSNKDEIMKALTEACTMLESKLACESEAATSPDVSPSTNRARESNVAALDGMYRSLSRHPSVEIIRIMVSSEAKTAVNDTTLLAIGLDNTGTEVSRYAFNIKMVPSFGNVISELRTAAGYSKLADSAKACEINYTDQGYGVPLIEKI